MPFSLRNAEWILRNAEWIPFILLDLYLMRIIHNFTPVLPIISSTSSVVSPSREDLVFKLEHIAPGRYGLPVTGASRDVGIQEGGDSISLVGLTVLGSTMNPPAQISGTVTLSDINGQPIILDTIRTVDWPSLPQRFTYGNLDLSIGSPFANEYGGFFVSQPPRSLNLTDGKIRFIMAPSDVPSRYCHDEFIGFAPAVLDPHLKFRTKISLIEVPGDNLEEAQLISIPITMTGSLVLRDNLSVPSAVLSRLDRKIRETFQMSWHEFERHSECHNMIDRLPTLRYTILDAQNAGVVDVMVSPSDYVSSFIDNRGIRYCVIQITSELTSSHTIGLPFIRSAGVFVDYTHNRFGFCDPL